MKKLILFLLLALAGVSVFSLKQKPKVEDGAKGVVGAATDTKINTEGSPLIGRSDAPLILYYWFDFQCSFCKQFDEEILPVLIDRYVSSGGLKVVFMNYQFLGPDSQTAGIVGQAVWEASPENYFKWHRAVFEKQDNSNSGWGNQADIMELVQSLPEINLGSVLQLTLKNESVYREKIKADKDEGARLNIKTTPSILIGGQVIRGAQPAAVYTQVIDSLL
ncbi:MAG TPA: thioredoxin domain-containing protein [Patescibacteria group bacterium]|nr:thioredoxin domain-containing protein [Patescibacteria group bacterium]